MSRGLRLEVLPGKGDIVEKRRRARARSPPRRGVRWIATFCCAVTFCGLWGGWSNYGEAGARTLGAKGQAGGEFSEPQGIAISQESAEAFIADRNNKRIDAFATSGPFLRAFGWGVASAREELQSCTSSCFEGYEGPGAGELSLPEGIAVDNDALSASHGDLYVWDSANLRVQKYSPSGEFILMFGGEVNASTKADVCLAGESCQAGVEGSGAGEFQRTVGNPIAVDASGVVYVGDVDRVQEFDSAGAQIGEVSLPGAGAIEQLAVDSAKDLYVKSSELAGARKYDLSGKELGSPRDEAGSPGPLAIGPANTLLVADGSEHILQYAEAGEQLKSFGAGVGASQGIAYEQAEGAVYALSESVVSVVSLPPAGPLVISESGEEVQPSSATLGAIVNPEGPEATEYHFEYGTSAAYGTSTAATPLSGEAFEDQSASAPITGLSPGTTYHFRVVAANAKGETTRGEDQTFTTLPAVSIEHESVSKITAFSARLEGDLNPHGLPTSYRFEYGTSAAYGQSVPIPDASAGAGSESTHVAVPIQGLGPASIYHYRLIAHNSLGVVAGPDQSFITQSVSSTSLIDGRAWEQVSPQNKQGTTIEAIADEGDVIQAAEDGAGISYATKSPISKEPQGNRSIANSQVLSERTSPGVWQSQDVATAHEEAAGVTVGEQSEYKLFSSELESAFVEPHGATALSPAASERTPYRREADGSYTPLINPANVVAGVKFGGEQQEEFGQIVPGRFFFSPDFITATPDGAHALVSSPQPLTPGLEFVENEAQNIFEWSDGALELVSVLPSGRATSQEHMQTFAGFANELVRNALSADGNRVVFEARVGSSSDLYVRDVGLQSTAQVDLAEAGVKAPITSGEPKFEGASSDGSRVLFLDASKLTGDASARGGEPDLYECEVGVVAGKLQCALRDLSVDQNPGEAGDVLGVLGADETGRYVYFVANGRLAAGAVAGDCSTEVEASATCNLYERDTVSGATRLVGVLSGADLRDWQPEGGNREDLGGVTSRVSPNGQYLAFMSERALTGFDNRDAVSNEADEEVFEYDNAAGTLGCVSCASSGARPEGVFDPGNFPGLLVDRPDLWKERWLAASLPGWTRVNVNHALYQSRYLSNSGRLFFNSATPLVPSDGNGLEDVYEYEPAGVGSCGLASGCVGLISSGGSSEESAFMDASADGSDVFFLTSAQLVKADSDNAYDIYDAHVCSTASPCAGEAASPPPPCATADACRAAPSPQPDIFGAPASQSFSGQGNVSPPAEKAAIKPPTRAEKLKKALASCKKQKNKKKRASCEKRAKKLYGPAKKPAKSKKKGKGKR